MSRSIDYSGEAASRSGSRQLRGIWIHQAALDITEEDWDKVLDVHAKGTFFCSPVSWASMIERGYGKIINLSSTWSASTDMGKSVYGIAKAGVSYMTAALSTEWAPLGVRVNAIAPTTTLTENTSRAFRENEARAQKIAQPDQTRAIRGAFRSRRRSNFPGKPASDFVTGHTLFVDGGWHAAL